MTDREFADLISETKAKVLSAIEKNLYPRFYHAIDDVAQETYLRAFRSLSANRFRGDSALTTWLYVIARNESLRMNRKLCREEEKIERSMNEMEMDVKTETDIPYSLDDVEKALTLLPAKYRIIMEAVYRGQGPKEIASSLGLRHGTVKSRAARGREMLHRLLQGGTL